ncbi:TPA: hypothetical protein H1005_03090 [archaeon]|uniref:Uncharacterized protein n=1 Tax=Candidatus Naiadarchaeum limnaeum TaxID=2756139 RepID=A0A832UPE6_9ARCH|nr:hypothetical protein [Candidatus Naiadarchaeales archaeon SRR2090153.bin1042]HIK00974.1 hypothetical protein [Candidatus Naiadarchaeum limnaeum]
MALKKQGESEELYEIVPTESYSDISAKSEQLEKEIEEIKTALKGAVGLAKVEAGAQTLITQMLDMVKTSQKLVEQVATSNQQLAQKVQEALDRMNETNAALSEKLGTILDTFMQATEAMEGEPEETEKMAKELNDSINSLIQQNARILATLESIEKNLRRTAIRSPVVPARAPARPVARRAPMEEGVEPGFEEELPPPPFPP